MRLPLVVVSMSVDLKGSDRTRDLRHKAPLRNLSVGSVITGTGMMNWAGPGGREALGGGTDQVRQTDNSASPNGGLCGSRARPTMTARVLP